MPTPATTCSKRHVIWSGDPERVLTRDPVPPPARALLRKQTDGTRPLKAAGWRARSSGRPTPPRYRIRNSSDHDAAPKTRGSWTIWVDPDMAQTPPPSGRRGHRQGPQRGRNPARLRMNVSPQEALRRTTGFIEALRAPEYPARYPWRYCSGYHRRSRVGTKMHRVKLPGQGPMARDLDRRMAGTEIRIAGPDGVTALGRPVTEAVGQVRPGTGEPRPLPVSRNRASSRRTSKPGSGPAWPAR